MARVQTRKNVSISAAKYAVERDCPPVALPPGKPRKVRT